MRELRREFLRNRWLYRRRAGLVMHHFAEAMMQNQAAIIERAFHDVDGSALVESDADGWSP